MCPPQVLTGLRFFIVETLNRNRGLLKTYPHLTLSSLVLDYQKEKRLHIHLCLFNNRLKFLQNIFIQPLFKTFLL